MTQPKQVIEYMTDHALRQIVQNGSGRDVLLASMLLDERHLTTRINDAFRRAKREIKRLKTPKTYRLAEPGK